MHLQAADPTVHNASEIADSQTLHCHLKTVRESLHGLELGAVYGLCIPLI